jgi:putative ABC transport system permease protein
MSFLAIALKNILRRPGRSLLTCLGIAVGIATIVTLINLSRGFESTWASAYNASRADLMVGKLTTHHPLPTPFSAEISSEVKKLDHVQEAAGVLTDLLSIEDAPAMIVFGWEPNSFLWNHLTLLEGRWPMAESERSVALGSMAAEILHKSLNDTVQIEDYEYRVCGRFASESISENGAILMPLHQLQEVTDRKDLISFLSLKLKPGSGPEAADQVRDQIRSRFKGFSAETTGEIIRSNIAIQAVKAMSLATSLVALVIGGIGIMNTVLMSVIERVHEIAILLAVGWRRSRIMKLILFESVLLSFIGGLAGTACGYLALHGLQLAPWFRGKIETSADTQSLVSAIILSVGLGALSGIYPALRASRISAVEGLHHE